MSAVVIALLVLLASLVLLGAVGWFAYRRVRSLARTVARASERVAAASADLEPLARREGDRG